MSPQDVEVRNYLQALEQRVQKLEAEAAAQSAPVDETLQPTYLQLTPAGLVEAVFPGGVQMDEQTLAAYSAGSALGWLDSAGSGAIREFIVGLFGGGLHQLQMNSEADANDYAQFIAASGVAGAAGSATTVVQTRDSTGANHIQTVLDSLGQSSFLLGGADSPPVITNPARALSTVYTPNVNHPTLVIANMILTVGGAAGNAAATLQVNGSGVATGQVDNVAQVGVIPLTALVPAGGTYELVPSTSGGGSTVLIDYVTEYQL